MHLSSILITILVSAATLAQGCSLVKDPDPEYNAVYAKVPCWLTMDSMCQPQLPSLDTRVVINHGQYYVLLKPISDSCKSEILKEQARAKKGKRNYGWGKIHGAMDVSNKDYLMLRNVPPSTMPLYARFANESSEYLRAKNERAKEKPGHKAVPLKV
ncbi:hypothetical protein F5X68DRAFT_227999 [Plectosphaerella plurivora]|uniref:Lipoprotein n=1 Tax=Plectosphaerella plurivora TaxID=936078 RepID=A0A9P9ABN4_9PEZI|nr:hypothetical protein F5X68DRAFT_227999 [Plectosphaerella plurivora]